MPALYAASQSYATRINTDVAQGAAAIIQYNTIDSPLAQPRNAIIGELLATVIGIGTTKIIQYSPYFEKLRWLAGGIAVGVASALMTVTKTIYPPAGATALLAAVDPRIQRLGWYLLPLVMLSTAITLITSLLINNIQRQYPTYWWTPTDLRSRKQIKEMQGQTVSRAVPSSKRWPRYVEHPSSQTITITLDNVLLPENVILDGQEKEALEILRALLA